KGQQRQLDFGLLSTRKTYLAASSAYERQVCNLELANTRLRQQVQDLQETLERARSDRGRFAELFAEAPVAYLLLNDGGVIHEANKAALRFLQLCPSHLGGITLSCFLSRADLPHFLAHLRDCRINRQQTTANLNLIGRKGSHSATQAITMPVIT